MTRSCSLISAWSKAKPVVKAKTDVQFQQELQHIFDRPHKLIASKHPHLTAAHLLVFYSGSRGNLRLGNIGSVVIRIDRQTPTAEAVWSAAMSYAHHSSQ
ncbi:uncharacterized protein PHALS_05834 [Plasmopara halstedii]|uniref:Uncharacterized protein n=1 Tax=Plasmopara halstedii TaxID=4781 RepID=A0A0P1ABM1_PLAHL|nr:uncharacterized protein PHALS_05834 [Plasmopara halstedii]CEG37778.1 hypothetical protein PHALS_05834 [Plasmopara halstedii]|eukprot:XP_024574147.1 hypothetical protein PHALS_05834 [Plasmopara halstedii]